MPRRAPPPTPPPSARNAIPMLRFADSARSQSRARKSRKRYMLSRLPGKRRNAMAGMLDGKAALITGAGGGIGRAAALVFAREGARLAVADLAPEAVGETVALVNAAGGQAISFSGDVTDAASVRAMVDGTAAAYGRIDCAFNNAGI